MAAIIACRKSSSGTQLTRAQHKGHLGPGVHDTTCPPLVIPKRAGLRCAFVQCTAHASRHGEQSACRHGSTRMRRSGDAAISHRQTGPRDGSG
ncbi:unnamed protein product [Chondrus crispus]|uniref:Uncharacterized protein n=1 Tax=Chondrus crispus TaxID=2769 RepID=R7QSS9_CHOCR|nr:unnamed protein product [Chondrus crispus]CDF40561.1 unnamed protein product [Chondrus crispus]|eukprot:XP_005710855.1 unnamed protein product [Chondrus crispus]